MRKHPSEVEGMGGSVSEGRRRETQVSGIPHPGAYRRVPLLRGIIAQRTKGTTELRMAFSGDPDIHKHRIKAKALSPYFAMLTQALPATMTSKTKEVKENGEQRGQELAK